MVVYQALELKGKDGKGSGLWHYACSDGKGAFAMGYCSPWEMCPDCGGADLFGFPEDPPCSRCNNTGLIRKEHPCPGHPTAKEAEAHQREFEIDHAQYLEMMDEGVQRKCEICGVWTQGAAVMGEWEQHYLCDLHRNRENLTLVAGQIGTVCDVTE